MKVRSQVVKGLAAIFRLRKRKYSYKNFVAKPIRIYIYSVYIIVNIGYIKCLWKAQRYSTSRN